MKLKIFILLMIISFLPVRLFLSVKELGLNTEIPATKLCIEMLVVFTD